MASTIWKFKLETALVNQRVLMPKGAEILSVQTQNEEPCLWAKFNKANEDVKEERCFAIHETGETITSIRYSYIGTYQLRGGVRVYHVFEVMT